MKKGQVSKFRLKNRCLQPKKTNETRIEIRFLRPESRICCCCCERRRRRRILKRRETSQQRLLGAQWKPPPPARKARADRPNRPSRCLAVEEVAAVVVAVARDEMILEELCSFGVQHGKSRPWAVLLGSLADSIVSEKKFPF